MKEQIKKALNKNEQQILRLFLHGETEETIVRILELSQRTVYDAKRKLYKYFLANSIVELCRNAVIFGYAQKFQENIKTLQRTISMKPLGMWEILCLHFLIEGKPIKEVEKILTSEHNSMDWDLTIQNIQQKLKIKSLENPFYAALVSGYIEILPVNLENIEETAVIEAVDQWMTTKSVLKVPQYQIVKRFHLKTKRDLTP